MLNPMPHAIKYFVKYSINIALSFQLVFKVLYHDIEGNHPNLFQSISPLETSPFNWFGILSYKPKLIHYNESKWFLKVKMIHYNESKWWRRSELNRGPQKFIMNFYAYILWLKSFANPLLNRQERLLAILHKVHFITMRISLWNYLSSRRPDPNPRE